MNYVQLNDEGEIIGFMSRPQPNNPNVVPFADVPGAAAALLERQREVAKGEIDQHAGITRQRFASPGDLLAAEYELAEVQATAYIDGGYSGDVPGAVQSHVDALGGTANEAADSIVATAAMFRALLEAIRTIRLTGKAAVEAATTQEEINQAKQAALDALTAV